MWDVVAVKQCGTCDLINSEPYDGEQVAYLLEAIDLEHLMILLIPSTKRFGSSLDFDETGEVLELPK